MPSAFERHLLPSKGEACFLNITMFSSAVCLIGWRSPCPWFYVMRFPWQENRWIIRKALQNEKNGAKCSYFADFWISAEVLVGIVMVGAATRFPPAVKALHFHQSLRQDRHYRFRMLLKKRLIQSLEPQETCIWLSCVAPCLITWGMTLSKSRAQLLQKRCLDRSKALEYLLQILVWVPWVWALVKD